MAVVINIACACSTTTALDFIRSVLRTVPLNLQSLSSAAEINLAASNFYHILISDVQILPELSAAVEKWQVINPKFRWFHLADEDKTYPSTAKIFSKSLLTTSFSEALLSKIADLQTDANTTNPDQHFIDQLSWAVFLVNAQGQLVRLNKAATHLLNEQGYTEPVNRRFQDYFPDAVRLLHQFQAEPGQFTSSLFLHQFFPENRGSGQPLSFIVSTTTDEEFLLIQNCPLLCRELNERQSTHGVLKSFSESLANQILNPVNNLYGRLQLLQNQLQDNPEFGRSFLTIETQVLRIQEIIMRLLTFAQLREDTIPRLLSVNEHVQLFLRQQGLPKQLAEAGVKLGLELVEPLPAISGFAHQIQIMLEMLGSMIIRHLRPGDELKIVTRKAENGLHRSVVQFIIHIVYNNKVSTGIIRNYWRDGTQYTRFGSIETIITQSIINAFHGQWQVVSDDESVESLIIEFPARA